MRLIKRIFPALLLPMVRSYGTMLTTLHFIATHGCSYGTMSATLHFVATHRRSYGTAFIFCNVLSVIGCSFSRFFYSIHLPEI
jgi:hypothetical protein